MAGQTVDQTQPTAKEESRKTDQNIAQELKKLQTQLQDAFRRYRDLIGQSVCDDHARHINSMRIALIHKEIKQINGKQIALFKRWRRTKEARRMQLKLARRRRLESDIDERFCFHFSARFRRHWDMALERLSMSDKGQSTELKSLALLDIVPKNVDKELRIIERDEPLAPLRAYLMKELGRDKAKKRSGARRLISSAGGSGEEGRQFKAPRCSKRIRGVSPTDDQSGDVAACSRPSALGSTSNGVSNGQSGGTLISDQLGAIISSQSAPCINSQSATSNNDQCVASCGEDNGTNVGDTTTRCSSAPIAEKPPEDDMFARSPSPKSGGLSRFLAPPGRKARSEDSRDTRRHFCCAFCRQIRRVSASVWSDDGVLWCRKCRKNSVEDSNTDKSCASVSNQRPTNVTNADDNTSHSTLSTCSTAALQ